MHLRQILRRAGTLSKEQSLLFIVSSVRASEGRHLCRPSMPTRILRPDRRKTAAWLRSN